MRPIFAISADGGDITPLVMDRLVSLSITDEQGIKSDRLRLELDDRDGRLAIPPHQAELRVALGYLETGLTEMGVYLIDQTSGSGMPQVMTIGATAADMSGSIRSPKTRGWQDTTLGDVVATIASEAGLEAAVGESIAGHGYRYVAQQAESDMNLLTRLAGALDATAKAADGRLVVMKRGTGQAADGSEIAPVPILRSQLTGWRWDISDRGVYKSARAEWQELGTAQAREVIVGEGEPLLRVREVQDTEAEARRVAEAALDRATRGEATLDLDCARFMPGLFAGGRLALVDLRPEIAGVWEITSVRHQLGQRLVTSVSAERGQAAE